MRIFDRGIAAALLFLAACSNVAAPAPQRGAGPGPQDVTQSLAGAISLVGAAEDHDTLVAAAGGASRILLGESTHGTHEFYRERARITERLIQEKGINAIAIEADWTPALRVNDYVRGIGSDRSAAEALSSFRHFPRWMWRNEEFAAFVEALRAHNLTVPEAQRVGLYGMDVYDLFDAADHALAYLSAASPASAERAKRHYRCFAPYGRDTAAYGEAIRNPAKSCQEETTAVLRELRAVPAPHAAEAREARFAATMSALSVVAAEEYYRESFAGSMGWNVRDAGMVRAVEEIAGHAEALSGRPGKVVLWSHNSHTGDARATDAANRGQVTIGQLMRERHGDKAFLVGFFTYQGDVMAAPAWGEAGRAFSLRPALAGSHSELFHRLGRPSFTLLLRNRPDLEPLLGPSMPQRAVGVIYAPLTERQSHYFQARLTRQFDAALFFDRTRAVRALPAG